MGRLHNCLFLVSTSYCLSVSENFIALLPSSSAPRIEIKRTKTSVSMVRTTTVVQPCAIASIVCQTILCSASSEVVQWYIVLLESITIFLHNTFSLNVTTNSFSCAEWKMIICFAKYSFWEFLLSLLCRKSLKFFWHGSIICKLEPCTYNLSEVLSVLSGYEETTDHTLHPQVDILWKYS